MMPSHRRIIETRRQAEIMTRTTRQSTQGKDRLLKHLVETEVIAQSGITLRSEQKEMLRSSKNTEMISTEATITAKRGRKRSEPEGSAETTKITLAEDPKADMMTGLKGKEATIMKAEIMTEIEMMLAQSTTERLLRTMQDAKNMIEAIRKGGSLLLRNTS